MKRLLDDLLDVSRVSQGKIELRKQPVELATLLLQAVEVSRPLMAEKRQQLALTLGHEPCRSTPIPPALVQVFANILNNAAKFTRRGGHITLSSDASRAATRSSRSATTAPGCRASCWRARSSSSRRRRAPSTAPRAAWASASRMVQTLVKMHGGSVQAFSEGPGRGTELVVRLPLAAAVTRAGRRARPRAAPRPRRCAPARAGGRRQRRRGGRDEARAAAGRSPGEGRVRRSRRARRDARPKSPTWCCSTSGCRAWTATRSRRRCARRA